jgi:hypothetical protein
VPGGRLAKPSPALYGRRVRLADRQEIEDLEEPKTPPERRYMTNDATIEKIAEILRDNPGGILYYRDEFMGWLRSLDKAGRETDRAFYLEAWNGNGSFSVDRTLHVPAVCVSVLGGIQAGPLTTYVTDALEDQGLRFALVLWGKLSVCAALRRVGERQSDAPPAPSFRLSKHRPSRKKSSSWSRKKSPILGICSDAPR